MGEFALKGIRRPTAAYNILAASVQTELMSAHGGFNIGPDTLLGQIVID